MAGSVNDGSAHADRAHAGTAEYDVVVVGTGAAGLTAALAAREALGESGRIHMLERSTYEERGGNTRWTGAYLRLEDVYEPAEGLVEDAAEFSEGYASLPYWERLLDLLPDTMEWLQAMGLRFHRRPHNFLSRTRPRLMPVGGGEAIVRILGQAAEERGITTAYRTTAVRLLTGDDGAVAGLVARDSSGALRAIRSRAVVLASGGYEGSARMKAQYFGHDAFKLRPVAPGGYFNKGEGIEMALAVGARADGQWDAFHAEPMDPRSNQPAPTNLAFPYGIIVNSSGRRFVDEGRRTVDENYEAVARKIREQEGSVAYLIGDQKMLQVSGIDRAILTDKKPVTAESVEDLAAQLAVPAGALTATIQAFNGSTRPGEFDPAQTDGLFTTGLEPPKSNWARPIDEPPFVAYPLACSVVFTFGGVATDLTGAVVTDDDVVIPGLYAAGECTGVYYGKYLGATSVLRSLIYGRVTGQTAAGYATSQVTA